MTILKLQNKIQQNRCQGTELLPNFASVECRMSETLEMQRKSHLMPRNTLHQHVYADILYFKLFKRVTLFLRFLLFNTRKLKQLFLDLKYLFSF